jgi:hypothetical protein
MASLRASKACSALADQFNYFFKKFVMGLAVYHNDAEICGNTQ